MSHWFDIRDAATYELIRTTVPRPLTFLDRDRLMRVAATIESCRFERPGVYLIELFCDDNWICDSPLIMLPEDVS